MRSMHIIINENKNDDREWLCLWFSSALESCCIVWPLNRVTVFAWCVRFFIVIYSILSGAQYDNRTTGVWWPRNFKITSKFTAKMVCRWIIVIYVSNECLYVCVCHIYFIPHNNTFSNKATILLWHYKTEKKKLRKYIFPSHLTWPAYHIAMWACCIFLVLTFFVCLLK